MTFCFTFRVVFVFSRPSSFSFLKTFDLAIEFLLQFRTFCKMVSRLLIGDNNLTKFWTAYQVSRPGLKMASHLTATDFDTFDHALSQSDEKEQVIVSVLTSLLLEETNQNEIGSSASNIFDQALTRLVGLCPRSPACQVFIHFSFLAFVISASSVHTFLWGFKVTVIGD